MFGGLLFFPPFDFPGHPGECQQSRITEARGAALEEEDVSDQFPWEADCEIQLPRTWGQGHTATPEDEWNL